ncbi:protein far1-related sequence 9 [Quercus suber]|uniref:Protein far1-related sequence 9 n=1 Tax=Quercus suber TaxID=58331 RepID=A0AAW0LNQ2_QUESU
MDFEPLNIENEVMEFDASGSMEDDTATLDLENHDDDYERDYNDESFEEEGAESVPIYNVAMTALQEAAKKVAAAKKHGSGVHQSALDNGSPQLQSYSLDQDKEIQALTAELENASQQCEAYRAKLSAVLKNLEEQKLKISVKVQNVRLNLRS